MNISNIGNIHLDEVINKYPIIFQPLGYDVLMGCDETEKPKVIGTFEMCVNTILTLLLMKPGQYPSIPDLGINVESYLLRYSSDKSIPMNIKTKLEEQCNRIQITGVSFEVYVETGEYGRDELKILITGDDRLTYGLPEKETIIGITWDRLNRLYAKRYLLTRRRRGQT
jgi:hypothetical protein